MITSIRRLWFAAALAFIFPSMPGWTCTAAATAAARDNGSDSHLEQLQQEQRDRLRPECPMCECKCEAPLEPTNTEEANGGLDHDSDGDGPGSILEVQILMFDVQGIVDMVEWNTNDYMQTVNPGVRIAIRKVPTLCELMEEIASDAGSGTSLFDAYYTNPIVLGTARGGLVDLAPYVKASPQLADWTDVLPVFRQHVTNFEDSIYILLLDGDTHALFYRRDVLEHFGLQVPRTWDEYVQVAKMVHGKVYESITLSGSCVSRIEGDHAVYWSHLVLSSITQTLGTDQGSLFDTADMKPLGGRAMAEMLRLHEEMAAYGAPDEFVHSLNDVHNAHLNDGSCVLTYSWGDIYKRSRAQGSTTGDKIGIAPTPGSQRVLDRRSGELVTCTKDLCPYGTYYDDIGWVNYAPYAANGGWGGAISKYTTKAKQDALADFFLWASSRQQSEKYVIPNATLPIQLINGQDPWRKSHLDVDKWVARGYTYELAKQYVDTILHNTQSKNVAVEIKFPKSGEIMSVLDREVHRHLYRAVVEKSIPLDQSETERVKVSNEITRQWVNIIRAYNTRGDTAIPILEVYQRLRGVYNPEVDLNQLTTVRPIGYALYAVVASFCFACAGWVVAKRSTRVVRASQPFFLLLICFGVFVLGSSIIPLGFDDSVASPESCSAACIATPCLVFVGFSVTFSALTTKLWRINLVYHNASRFHRVKVTVTDVIKPLLVLLTVNVALLAVWLSLDTPYWSRVSDGRNDEDTLESHGACNYASKPSSIVILSLLALVNFAALVLANVQAYRSRNVSSDFSEGKYIGFIMISMTQAFLIGLPVLLLAHSSPVALFVVASLLVFVICMSTQCLLFIPKYVASLKPPAPVRRSIWSSTGADFRSSQNFEPEPVAGTRDSTPLSKYSSSCCSPALQPASTNSGLQCRGATPDHAASDVDRTQHSESIDPDSSSHTADLFSSTAKARRRS